MHRYDEAVPLLEEGLAINKLKLPAHHEIIGDTMNTLGCVYLAGKRYEEAIATLTEAVEFRQTNLPQGWGLQLAACSRLVRWCVGCFLLAGLGLRQVPWLVCARQCFHAAWCAPRVLRVCCGWFGDHCRAPTSVTSGHPDITSAMNNRARACVPTWTPTPTSALHLLRWCPGTGGAQTSRLRNARAASSSLPPLLCALLES